MLIRIPNEHVARYWPTIRQGLEVSLPPTVKANPAVFTNIQNALLMNEMDCFGVLAMRNNEPILCAFMLTTLQFDAPSQTQNLLIYSLYGYVGMTDDLYRENLEDLRRIARSFKCKQIVAYTDVDRIVQLAQSLGGTARTFISIDV